MSNIDMWGRAYTISGSGPYTLTSAELTVEAGSVEEALAVMESMHPPQKVPPPPPPDSVDAFKAKMQLASTASKGTPNKTMLEDVDALVPSLPIPQQIAWQQAGSFSRTSPLLNALAAQLGLSSAEVDELFVAANAIEV